ncbi:PREDICTED: olfactory receptor 52K1-like [Poecilia mexicana]|uniref:G-protein coupled receptors family 1 profile domain-containing protein n=1 Tax=Poecilia mexicana TaxID=48701 RepID=A0A3B3WFC2_9TELE|nr:PREDICTED: olfactory receptor 52K1-like [Poecilia mexicana]
MENTTLDPDLLLLEGLKVTPHSSVPAFILLLLIYVFVMLSNVSLVTIIALQRSLHQPMFLLFCSMGANDVLGASTIIPPMLSTVFTPTAQRYIRYSSCVLQAFFAHFHASVIHTVLMIMAFDRYVAVCKPLHYATIMTSRMVVKLSVWAWAVCLLLVLVLVGLSVRLSRCRAVVLNPFCDNPSLFKLSCDSILVNNIYGLAYTVVLLGSSLGSITLTYLRIAIVCLTNRSRTNSTRALQTCSTHLVLYIITFLSGALIIVLHRFPELSDQRKMASILFHVIPPAMNAVIYGLQIKAVRQKIFILFTKNTMADMKG